MSGKRAQRPKDKQWEAENARIHNARKRAQTVKQALRRAGCRLPFYELLDSYNEAFQTLLQGAKREFPSLYEVYEVDAQEMKDFSSLGLPASWTHIRFPCEDQLAGSYTADDPSANLYGCTTWFQSPTGEIRSIIRLPRKPACGFVHSEFRRGWNLPVLLHEVGHVKDSEIRQNIDPTTARADVIEAEVFANVYCLTECYRRAYFSGGETVFNALAKHATEDPSDYRTEVARRVVSQFQRPQFKRWTDYEL